MAHSLWLCRQAAGKIAAENLPADFDLREIDPMMSDFPNPSEPARKPEHLASAKTHTAGSLPRAGVPVFNCIVYVARGGDGGTRARVANLPGLKCAAGSERKALRKAGCRVQSASRRVDEPLRRDPLDRTAGADSSGRADTLHSGASLNRSINMPRTRRRPAMPPGDRRAPTRSPGAAQPGLTAAGSM